MAEIKPASPATWQAQIKAIRQEVQLPLQSLRADIDGSQWWQRVDAIRNRATGWKARQLFLLRQIPKASRPKSWGATVQLASTPVGLPPTPPSRSLRKVKGTRRDMLEKLGALSLQLVQIAAATRNSLAGKPAQSARAIAESARKSRQSTAPEPVAVLPDLAKALPTLKTNLQNLAIGLIALLLLTRR